MRRYVGSGIILLAVLVAAGLAAPGRSPAGPDEYDFGDRVVAVTVRTKDEKNENRAGYLTKARVRRLGDQSFLTGEPAAFGDQPSLWEGVAVWLPLSEVLQIIEFKDAETARKVTERQRGGRAGGEPK